MSRFCTHCGRPLQEGEVCTCQTTNQNAGAQEQTTNYQEQVTPVQPKEESPQASAGSQQQREFVKQSKGVFLRLLRKPVTAGREVIAAKDANMALLFFVLQGVASTLFAFAFASTINSVISAAGALMDGLSELGIGSLTSSAISLSYVQIAVVTILLSVAFSFALALLLKGADFVLKTSMTFKQMMAAASIRSVLMVPTILVALILYELNAGIGIFLLITGNLWGFTAMILVVSQFVPQEKRDIMPLVFSAVILIFALVVFLVMSKAWVYYLPSVLRTAFKALQNVSMQDLISEIL